VNGNRNSPSLKNNPNNIAQDSSSISTVSATASSTPAHSTSRSKLPENSSQFNEMFLKLVDRKPKNLSLFPSLYLTEYRHPIPHKKFGFPRLYEYVHSLKDLKITSTRDAKFIAKRAPSRRRSRSRSRSLSPRSPSRSRSPRKRSRSKSRHKSSSSSSSRSRSRSWSRSRSRSPPKKTEKPSKQTAKDTEKYYISLLFTRFCFFQLQIQLTFASQKFHLELIVEFPDSFFVNSE